MQKLFSILMILLASGCAITYPTPQDGEPYKTDLGVQPTVWGPLQSYVELRTLTTTPPYMPSNLEFTGPYNADVKGVLLIEPDGTVSEVKLHQSCGSPELDKAVLTAFKKWTFPPAEDGNQRVSISRVTIKASGEAEFTQYND